MSTKKAVKRPVRKKPTQLDRIETAIGNAEVRIMQRMDSLMDAFAGRLLKDVVNMGSLINERLDAQRKIMEPFVHQQESKPDPWVPKVGDVVVTLQTHLCEEFRGMMVKVSSVDEDHNHLSFTEPVVGCAYYAPFLNQIVAVRPATPAEIAQWEQEQKWKGIEELQPNDACELTIQQRRELTKLGATVMANTDLGAPNLRWDPPMSASGQCLTPTCAQHDFNNSGFPQNWLPFPEFKRRLQGTAARLAKEEASQWKTRRLQWPQLVEHDDKQAIVLKHGDDYPVANNGMGWVSITYKDGGHNSVSPTSLTISK